MSAEKSAAGPQVKPNQALIVGRIQEVRKGQGEFYTVIKMPTVDEYSSSEPVEVSSKSRLGNPGEDVRVLVQLGGYIRTAEVKDKETGELLKMKFTTVRLRAVAE